MTASQISYYYYYYYYFFFEKISEWLLLKVGWDEICMFITYLVFLANVLLKKFKHTEVALHFVHKQYFLKKKKKRKKETYFTFSFLLKSKQGPDPAKSHF